MRIAVGIRSLMLAVLGLAAVAVVATMPQLLGHEVARAVEGVERARPEWLWLAAGAFLAALLCSAWAWRSVISSCGGALDRPDAAARYGAGSLLNLFLPGPAGDALRVALFGAALGNEGRFWTASGTLAIVGVARCLVLALLLVFAASIGALPLWPVLVLAGAVALAGGVAAVTRGWTPGSRIGHALDAFRAVGRQPWVAARVVGWVGAAASSRFVAATAIAAALGVRSPLSAALIVLTAMALAGLIPITPAGLGVKTGAIAVALKTHGVALTTALSAGLAYQAVETAVGLAFGLASVLLLAPFPSPAARRWVVGLTGASACVGIAAAFGATVLA